MSRLCFGVYLVHDFYLTVWKLIMTNLFGAEIPNVFFQIVFCIVASFGTAWVLGKIPVLGKYIS